MVEAPGYWLYETSGRLRPAVWELLRGGELDDDELLAVRQYLRQWIAGDWQGEIVDDLRRDVDRISSTDDVRDWLAAATAIGIDPL